MADLDKIISNLEQQKNMQTFGLNQEDAPSTTQPQNKSHWVTLQEARAAHRPTSSNSANRVPLAPKRSDANVSRTYDEDAYSDNSRSHTSKSPQRVGKFAQMAID